MTRTWHEKAGWAKLVNPLIRHLESRGCYIMQTKEKFGEFRCYYSTPDDMPADEKEVLRHAVYGVEALSKKICHDCGSTPAKLMYDGWVLPMCEPCATKKGREWDNGEEPTYFTNAYKVDTEC